MTPVQIVALREFLNSQDFYEVCQQYRHASELQQSLVVSRFDALKKTILEGVQLAMAKDKGLIEFHDGETAKSHSTGKP